MNRASVDAILGDTSPTFATSGGGSVSFQQTAVMKECALAIQRLQTASLRPGRPLQLSPLQLPPIF
jgi:hypothetical protein